MVDKERMSVIVISDSYRPTTATSNRLLAILKGLNALGCQCEMTFVYENKNGDQVDSTQYANIKFNYLLNSREKINKRPFLKLILSLLYLRKYIKRLPNGATILLMDGTVYLPLILQEKRFKVYAERTEHPSITMMPSWINPYFMRQYEKLDGLFVISTALKDYYTSRGVSNVEIINMIVDGSRFSNLEKTPNREKYIAYCGTVTNNKDGVNDLIRSYAIVHASHPEYKLYIIGPIPSIKERNGNIDLIKDLGLEKSVFLTGVVTSNKLPQMLLDSEVLVLARPENLQAKYGFPTKLGEYLMTSNPVVVTSVGDIPLFLEDGKSAFLATPGDCQDIANKINWAIENPEESSKIGDSGKAVALANFNNEKESRKMLEMVFRE